MEQIATLYSLARQKPALMRAPCTAPITQLPIHSATRKGNCPVFMTLRQLLIPQRRLGVVTLVQQIKTVCEALQILEGVTFAGKWRPAALHIHENTPCVREMRLP